MQLEQHSMVAESVRLNSLQAEEFGHAFVVGLQQLFIDVMINGRFVDLDETVLGKESHHESKAEDSSNTDPACAFNEGRQDQRPDALSKVRACHRQGANFSEVLPHDMQRTAGHNLTTYFDHNELLNIFKKCHRGLGQQVTV